MQQIVDVILPVFGLIAIGYLTAATRLLSENVGDALGDFVFTIAVPLLIFRTLATADFAGAAPWPLWIAYFTGVAVSWGLALAVIRLGFGRDARAGVIAGVSSSFSNLVLVGTPLVMTAFGEEGLVPIFLVVSVQLPVMMVVSTLLIERAGRQDRGPVAVESGGLAARLARNIFTNPLIVAILAGAAWRMTGLPIPGPAKSLVDGLAAAAIPCALFSLGMGLKRYGIAGNIGPATILTALKLIVMPAVVWAVVSRFPGVPPLWVKVLTIGAATPTGVNAYLIAVRFRTGHGLASNTITLTTALAVLTVTMWLHFFEG
ncbi:MAG TPA: AEC family transporter [Kaistiaceae bacterium]|nr:AEC family transporter [Kaistiaceae bacterium]